MAHQSNAQNSNQNLSSTSNRGFASMDKKRQREIASLGGRAAHEQGTAHEFTSQEAAEAGRKGGQIVSQNRQHMAAIGAKGGQARAESRRRKSSLDSIDSSSSQEIETNHSFSGGPV